MNRDIFTFFTCTSISGTKNRTLLDVTGWWIESGTFCRAVFQSMSTFPEFNRRDRRKPRSTSVRLPDLCVEIWTVDLTNTVYC